jgi:outer membrane protein TolC
VEVHVKTRSFLCALGMGLAVCANVMAVEPAFVVGTAPGQQARGVRLGAPELRLSLQDATALALEHNLNLEVSRLGFASAQQGFVATTGVFDSVLKADAGASYSEALSTNQLAGAAVGIQRGRQFDLYLSKLTATGGGVTLGWTNVRSATNSTFYYLNPAYNSGLTLSFTQSLLRGFGTDVNRAQIEVARRNMDISRVEFEQSVINTVQAVESAYWNLVYAIDNLKVKQHSLKLAQDLLDQTRTRVRIGTSAPIDIVQSEATVASREVDIIVAENQVGNAGDVLKGLMGFENPEDWKSRIVPTDALGVTTTTASLDDSISRALQNRPELRQRQLETQISQINLLSAKNGVLPQLDFSLRYGLAGVGGTQTIFDPTTGKPIGTVSGGWDDPLSQIVNRKYNNWGAQVNFSVPLRNTTARANLVQARFGASSARQNTALTQQGIISDVRTAVRGLEASARGITAAAKSRELAERNLDAEQKKFDNGMSTAFNVVKIQDDLASAQAAELQSRVYYRQAEAVYRAAVGSLLETMGVRIRDEKQPEEKHTGLKDVKWLQYGHRVDLDVAAPPPSK